MLAGIYQLKDCKRSMRKTDIYGKILRYCVEHRILEDRGLEISQERGVESSFSEQLAIKRMEMEERQKNRELELELKRWN